MRIKYPVLLVQENCKDCLVKKLTCDTMGFIVK